MHINTILHIPHASTFIPMEHRKSLLIDDAALEFEILRLTDWYTDQLFDLSDRGARIISFPVSRIVCDPERFVDDQKEPASRVGMGCVYTHTSLGIKLRDTESIMWPKYRQAVISQYYEAHHAALHDAVEHALTKVNYALIVDAHSFPNDPLPTETNPSKHRPDVCIGTDCFHTSESLRDCAVSAFERIGFSVAVNSPFEGVVIPTGFAHKDPRVQGVMIEINRDVYLEQGNCKRVEFDAIGKNVCRAIEQIASAVMSSRG